MRGSVTGRRAGDGLDALLRATRALRIDVDLTATLQRIAHEAWKLSGAADVAVSLVDRATGTLALVAGSTPGAGRSVRDAACAERVAASGEVLLARADESGGGPDTLLALPMKPPDHLLGVLTFRTPGSREYGARTLASLGFFADQAALAVENTRLVSAAAQHGQRLRR